MKLYRFSPIKTEKELLEAITYTNFACFKLCKHSFGKYLPVAGNIGIFCHYDEEYKYLTNVRKKLTDESEAILQKYFRLHTPIIISAYKDIPKTAYTHLYIRKPDPYRAQVGDVDFYLKPEAYKNLKKTILDGTHYKGARLFPRGDLDMIELIDPDIDACGYVRTNEEIVRQRT